MSPGRGYSEGALLRLKRLKPQSRGLPGVCCFRLAFLSEGEVGYVECHGSFPGTGCVLARGGER